MRIILAETGQDFEFTIASSGSNSSNELLLIKLEIEKKFHIKSADQILISATGMLIKESDTRLDHSIIVAFNRRVLQDHATVQRLMNTIPEVTDSLIDSNTIPNLKELESTIYLYGVEERDEDLYDTLDHIIQVCIQASTRRRSMIEQFVREFSGQAIALNAALNNLESHVRTAHQTIGKFDRIAQREFSKHAVNIATIDLDISLLENIQLHPRVCHISNSVQLDRKTTLGTFVPLKELEKAKQTILSKYDELVSATLEQKNKVAYLHQQTANVSTQRTTSDIVIERVQKMKNEVDRFTESMLEIGQRIYDELKRRKRQKKKQSLHLDLVPPPSPPCSSSVTGGGMDGSSTLTVKYPLSPPTTHENNHRKKKTQYILRDAVRSLYLHETFIQEAEKSVIKEKQTCLKSFIQCMQSISQVEESVTKVYPRLAELEKEIKTLRKEIEKGKGATARRVIAGYGLLLIELWRRDKYTEIVKGNSALLQSLFGEFGQLEKSYRKKFENEIICLDKNQILSAASEEHNAILPFQMQLIDDPPVICSTSTNASAEDDDNVYVTRKEVEEYIRRVHSHYASSMPINNNEKKSKLDTKVEVSCDVSHILARSLEKEAKRIRAGLAQLGLPGTRVDGNVTASVMIDRKDPTVPTSPSSSSTTSSVTNHTVSSFPSAYFTPNMKLASSPASQFLDHHLPNMSPTAASYQQQQKDWELEKASILRQSQEYRKYIEDLRMKHEQDKIKHEKDKQSLLRKLHTQENRIEEIKKSFESQIQDCQIQLENAEKNHKIKEGEWKQKCETTLQTEQEKNHRRISGFHQRMIAKDEEYAKLEETYLRETKSAPSSPTSSAFISVRRVSDSSPPIHIITQKQHDRVVAEFDQKINDLVSAHQAEIAKLQQEKQDELEQLRAKLQEEHREQLLQMSEALRSEHKGSNDKFLTLIDSLEEEKKTYVEKLAHFDALKNQMDLDRTREFNMLQSVIDDLKSKMDELKEKHQSKIIQMNEKFNSSEARMKSLYINENQQITMQCEARIANLIAEHQNNLQELKDTFENEKEVIQIKHQSTFDEHARASNTKQSEWTQTHKSLKNEIKKLNQVLDGAKAKNEKLRIELRTCKKDSSLKTKELMNLQQEQRAARRIARDIVSLSSDYRQSENIDPNARLLDLLSRTLSNITTLKTCNNIMEQSMEPPTYMMNMSSYGF